MAGKWRQNIKRSLLATHFDLVQGEVGSPTAFATRETSPQDALQRLEDGGVVGLYETDAGEFSLVEKHFAPVMRRFTRIDYPLGSPERR